eukprot:CAMPEP_0113456628 /NCGR_PEP_ID=MMETSP0014_2-20120614/8985_1 /TAXON_ID=2857 /ORGANISM="Nitzschia sp." /LENGTH=610 /DNA_ID=CAMNT_0000348087 /DNA_START=109 /DNA_END=1938 /DNA_ORIENTATION=- /assembly_acc=CAM_ASM_000159
MDHQYLYVDVDDNDDHDHNHDHVYGGRHRQQGNDRDGPTTTTQQQQQQSSSSVLGIDLGGDDVVCENAWGCLDVSVLSVCDLPWDDVPTILISACGKTEKAGPPISRNRQRNSFRFSRSSSSSTNLSDYGEEGIMSSNRQNRSGATTPATSNVSSSTTRILPTSSSPSSPSVSPPVQLIAPLKELFRCTTQIRIIYLNKKNKQQQNNNNTQYLECYIDIRDNLRINESKWLVLHLKPTAPTYCDMNKPQLSSSTTSSSPGEASQSKSQVAATSYLHGMFPSTSTNNVNLRDDLRDDEDNHKVLQQQQTEPTIRLKLLLHGNYRPWIASLIRFFEAYFEIIDVSHGTIHHFLNKVYFDEYARFLLLPLIPVVVGVLVVSPLLAGTFMVGLPIFLPIVLIVIWINSCLILMGGILIASTKQGRTKWFPYLSYFVDTPLGQRIMYETGPRPTIVSMVKRIVPTSCRPNSIYDDDLIYNSGDPMANMWSKLLLSLAIDSIGSASYMLPVVGEVLDVVYAPIQTVTIMAMYDYVSWWLQYLSFMEEILFWTDVVPSATIGWLLEYVPILYSNDKDGTFIIEQVVSDLTLTDREEEEEDQAEEEEEEQGEDDSRLW